jgi:putative transposase
MPNHVHGIIIITEDVGAHGGVTQDVGAHGRTPLHRKPRSSSSFVAGFKSAATKRINAIRGNPGTPVWQRNYYEHIIRNENALNAVRRYIQNNPLMWPHDMDNPTAPRLSIEDANRVLARYYGFTDEEAGFIINYYIKYQTRQKDKGK